MAKKNQTAAAPAAANVADDTKTNKSDLVRKLLAEGVTSPQEIVDKLHAQGIEISKASVSTIKSNASTGGRRNGSGNFKAMLEKMHESLTKARAFAKACGGPAKAKEQLEAFEEFVNDCGDIESAKAALEALDQFKS